MVHVLCFMIYHALKFTNACNNNMSTQYDHTFVGGRGREAGGRGNEARGPQQITLPDQPKLGCYGPAVHCKCISDSHLPGTNTHQALCTGKKRQNLVAGGTKMCTSKITQPHIAQTCCRNHSISCHHLSWSWFDFDYASTNSLGLL